MALIKSLITYWALTKTNTTYDINNKTKVDWKLLRDSPLCETRW